MWCTAFALAKREVSIKLSSPSLLAALAHEIEFLMASGVPLPPIDRLVPADLLFR